MDVKGSFSGGGGIARDSPAVWQILLVCSMNLFMLFFKCLFLVLLQVQKLFLKIFTWCVGISPFDSVLKRVFRKGHANRCSHDTCCQTTRAYFSHRRRHSSIEAKANTKTPTPTLPGKCAIYSTCRGENTPGCVAFFFGCALPIPCPEVDGL